jgi:3-methyl-2-oxobutanoate hydroxymethyltransferase
VKKDLAYIQAKKRAGEPIVMLTCYDYPTAVLEEEAGVDVIFVGDSVGTNVLGYASETEVTMADMLHHLRAVRRGVKDAYLLADMPYRAYETPEVALTNARAFLAAGADGVKLEGGAEQESVVRALAEAGIAVCGHIGFTPQTLGSKGRVQGRALEQARALIESAETLERAGLRMIVLELVTEPISKLVSERLRIPTIGIGSGRYCDGQVLVVNDMLGVSTFERKMTKKYADLHGTNQAAITAYTREVRERQFPAEANSFTMDEAELAKLREWAAITA